MSILNEKIKGHGKFSKYGVAFLAKPSRFSQSMETIHPRFCGSIQVPQVPFIQRQFAVESKFESTLVTIGRLVHLMYPRLQSRIRGIENHSIV